MTTDDPSLGRLVATLTGDRADVASLARVLTGALADALPPGVVDVTYDRSMADRMHGRPGRPVAIGITFGDTLLSISPDGRGEPQPQIAHTVRGVVLSRRPTSMAEWVQTLAEKVAERAEQDAQAREVLSRLLFG
jgi:hypothetical protein